MYPRNKLKTDTLYVEVETGLHFWTNGGGGVYWLETAEEVADVFGDDVKPIKIYEELSA
jgi:hypothetical protein